MIQVTVLLSNSKNVFQKPHIQILLENQFYRKNIFKLKLQQFYSKRKTVHAKIIRNNLVLQYFFIR